MESNIEQTLCLCRVEQLGIWWKICNLLDGQPVRKYITVWGITRDVVSSIQLLLNVYGPCGQICGIPFAKLAPIWFWMLRQTCSPHDVEKGTVFFWCDRLNRMGLLVSQTRRRTSEMAPWYSSNSQCLPLRIPTTWKPGDTFRNYRLDIVWYDFYICLQFICNDSLQLNWSEKSALLGKGLNWTG